MERNVKSEISVFISSLVKGEAIPLQTWTGPEGSRRLSVEAPRLQDNQYMKVVRLSALCTGRLYPAGNIPGTHFC
jgi:hypothetical protein